MASDKLMNHTQGETIITKLTSIADSLDDLAAVTPAKLGLGMGVCDTAASTAAKTVAIANYTITEGSPVSVQFLYANTAANATLNINNTGAKPILYKGNPLGNNVISAGDTCTFIYTTNSYRIINIDTLTGAGTGTVTQVGAENGLITDQSDNADIQHDGKIGLNLKSTTAFSTEVGAHNTSTDNMYPVALDSEGHPVAAIPNGSTTAKGTVQLTDSVGTSSSASETDVPTEKAVAEAIESIGKPMVWTGTITLTADSTDTTKCSIAVSKPASTANIKQGMTYRIGSIAASPVYTGPYKVGDTFIASKDVPDVTASWIVGTDWDYTPSGDEPSGTVTGVKMTSAGTTIDPDGNGVVTLTAMGASGTGHKAGLVPDPGSTSGTKKYLREDGTWNEPTGDNLKLTGYEIDTEAAAVAATDTINEGIGKLEYKADANATNILYVADQIGKNNLINLYAARATAANQTIASGIPFNGKSGQTYVISYNTSLTTGVLTFGMKNGDTSVQSVEVGNSAKVKTFTLSGDTDKFNIFSSVAGTFSNFIICTEEEWNLSHGTDYCTLLNRVKYNTNMGVKNICNNADFNNGTKTVSNVTFTTLPDGTVTVKTPSGQTSTTDTNIFYNVWFKDADTIIIPEGTWMCKLYGTDISNIRIEYVYRINGVDSGVERGNFGEAFEMTIPTGISASWLRICAKPSTSFNSSFKIVVCDKAAWEADPPTEYIPYTKSNYQLTADKLDKTEKGAANGVAELDASGKVPSAQLPSSMTPTSHTHGNITNDGTITAAGVALASGDSLAFVDSSDNSKIKKTSVTFDGSTTTKALTPSGTFETFLQSHQTIKHDGVSGATVNRFGTCGTAAATAAKTVSITTGTFTLEAGARVTVKFTNANTADTPTLNVASKGAKNIFHKGAQITTGGNKSLLAGTVDFIYDGTQWHLIGNYIDTNDNTYPSAYCSTAAGTAAKVATCTNYALLSKSYIHVIITTANTSASALTLNINSKGAKPIYINGSASSSSNYTLPAGSYLVYYNGTNYYFRTDGKITAAGIVDIGGNTGKYFKGDGTLVALPTASTSAAGIVQLSNSLTSTSQTVAATSYAVKQLNDTIGNINSVLEAVL